MGLLNGEFVVTQLLRQLKVDDETSDLISQLISRYATTRNKTALVKSWLEAALAAPAGTRVASRSIKRPPL